MDVIETRELWTRGGLTVSADMVTDEDNALDRDFDSAEDARDYQERYARGDFIYVGIVVRVDLHDVEIGTDSLWGIEHGTVGTDADGKDINGDAYEFTPAEFPAPRTIVMSSPLASVVDEALSNAAEWATTNGSDAARALIREAMKWANPNARAWRGDVVTVDISIPTPTRSLAIVLATDEDGNPTEAIDYRGERLDASDFEVLGWELSNVLRANTWADSFGVWHVRVDRDGIGERVELEYARLRLSDEISARESQANLDALRLKRVDRTSQHGTLSTEYVEDWPDKD